LLGHFSGFSFSSFGSFLCVVDLPFSVFLFFSFLFFSFLPLLSIQQNGNWSCFRNEFHHSSDPEKSITPKYFFPIPTKGKLEFDFVNIERPNPAVSRAADYDRIIDVLLISCLLEEEFVKDAVCRINDLNLVARRSILPDGNPYWRTTLSRAMLISDHLFAMYSSLSSRYSSRKKALKRELIKSMVAPSEGKGRGDKGRRTTGGMRQAGFYSSSASVVKKSGGGGGNDKKNSISSSSATTAGVDHHNEVHHISSGTVVQAEKKENEGVTPVAAGAGEEGTSPPDNKMMSKVKMVAKAFRSLVYKSKAENTTKTWGRRLTEVKESTGSDEYKASMVLEFFEAELTSLWLYCVHLSILLELFTPIGLAARSSLGSYRVELVILLFDRILDLHNFEFVLMVLNAEEQAALYARLGLLNIFNPCKPEGGFAFDLHRWEERQVKKQ
jgi:hypothetical protein